MGGLDRMISASETEGVAMGDPEADRVQNLARAVVDKYGGDASKVWEDAPTKKPSRSVRRRCPASAQAR